MKNLLHSVGQAIYAIDHQRPQHHYRQRIYKQGIGPFGEPQMVKMVKNYFKLHFNNIYPNAKTQKTPDFLVPNIWAIEFKIVRPFGDNGNPAENWSENLIHPYPGNESSIGDIYKLLKLKMNIRIGIIVVTYEHNNPQISLAPLLDSFELISRHICKFNLGPRHHEVVNGLVHPIHQRANLYGWEILRNNSCMYAFD